MHYRNYVITLFILALFVITGSANAWNKKPKNLKVLPKDISDERLDSIMQTYNKALGVCCDFCHAKDKDDNTDYASDANPVKEVARRMMKMTIDINKNYFNTDKTVHPAYLTTVGCYTCHKGDAYPQQGWE